LTLAVANRNLTLATLPAAARKPTPAAAVTNATLPAAVRKATLPAAAARKADASGS
jgi:hypothetical protein